METRKHPPTESLSGRPDARRHPRYRFFRDLQIVSPTCGMQTAHTIDISESGVSALLNVELPLDEFVELRLDLPSGPLTVHATVRQHQAFRYGFEFSAPRRAQEAIQATCRELEKKQALQARKS